MTTVPQLTPGKVIPTLDGPLTVVMVGEMRYRTNFGKWHRHTLVLVEDSGGQRQPMSPQLLYKRWRATQ